MSNLSKALAAVGVAKQSAFGTPATQPTFLFGLRGGSPIKVDIDQEPEERTSATYRGRSDANRNAVIHGMDFKGRAHPGSIGLLLYAALGAIADTGPVSGVYTHTITPGQDLPYLTFWGLFGGAHIYRLQDARIDELEITWDGPKPLEVACKAIGTIPGYPSSVTPTNDEQQATKFAAGGGLFKAAMASSTPVTAPVKAGGIKISNALEPVGLSVSVVPQDVALGNQSYETKLTTVPTDLAPWREIVTGSTGGTTISEAPVFGSYETKFAIDANTDLDITATRIAYKTDLPEADPGGGVAELDLVGEPLKPSGGNAITCVLRNTIAAY